MPIVNGNLVLEENAPFEEVFKNAYINFLDCMPPERWSRPYDNFGWFFCGEPYSHDPKTGEPYHYLFLCYNERYYAGCRSVEKSNADIEFEISAFCRKLDEARF